MSNNDKKVLIGFLGFLLGWSVGLLCFSVASYLLDNRPIKLPASCHYLGHLDPDWTNWMICKQDESKL